MTPRTRVLRSWLFVVLAAAASAACTDHGPTRPSALPLGQPFDLRVGTSAAVEGGLLLTFTRVVSDSRCPIDALVLCVWAGEGVVALRLAHRTGGTAERDVRTEPSASVATFHDYAIRLDTLQPHPRSDREIRPDEYVATFTVTAR